MGGIQGLLSLVGRVLLCAVFVMGAATNHIPNFNNVVGMMQAEGVPAPRVMLIGAIAFMLVGSLSVILGYKARCGAVMLLVFLALANYFFHDFWTLEDVEARQMQMGFFMSNLALIGAMLLIIANGPGAWSLDGCCKRTPSATENPTA